MTAISDESDCVIALREQRAAVWLRPRIAGAEALSSLFTAVEVAAARARFTRFEPVLAGLFAQGGWDGRIRSELFDFPAPDGAGTWLVKGDHALPITGSIKARGGVHELLCIIERIAKAHGLAIDDLTSSAARAVFSRHRVVVASTGNLGYSIGMVGRALGLGTEIHMSSDAKAWKRHRLRELGATLVEHECDYSETMVRARTAAAARTDTIFVDDENSRDLLAGYAVAADELAQQLDARGIVISAERPLIVYLPCGVGGAPGGITYGLKRRFGTRVVVVWVEPLASPCVMVALASGGSCAPSVYDYGCDNDTIADGLAVPRASELVLAIVGDAIDAAVAVPDTAMLEWLRIAWHTNRLKLEPSAAAGFAAYAPFIDAGRASSEWPDLNNAVHLFWATGGSKVPEPEFGALLSDTA